MGHLKRAREVFDIELAGLKAVRAQLDAAFDRAVDLIVSALRLRGKIVVVGVGKSGNVGHKIAATLTSTGSTSVVLHSVDALHGDLGIVGDGDVILALSYSGETDELLNLLPALKRFSVKVISLTGAPRSSLARHSDVVLNVRVPREACPFNLAPTASTKALLVMTRAKSGSVSVVNARGKLTGVFTDGDLRRRVAAEDNVLSQPLAKVMTRRPISVREDALAVEALKIFNERNIDDLIVVNARKEPVGLVDSQDLPKWKLM